MKYLMPESYTEGKDGFGWLLKQFAHTDVLKHCERPFTFARTIINQRLTRPTASPCADRV